MLAKAENGAILEAEKIPRSVAKDNPEPAATKEELVRMYEELHGNS